MVTFNFDNLLEEKLEARKIRFRLVTGRERQHGGGLPIIHPHGYIPHSGPIVRENIVSMSDPNLRRLLDASRNSEIRRARNYARITGASPESVSQPYELVEAIRAAVAQADTEVFESMGVKTIWVDSFEQIPDSIAAIPNGAVAKAAGE